MRVTLLLSIVVTLSLLTASKADFGQAIVDEAVNLGDALVGGEDGDPRSMEDLLHWAISHSDPQKLAAQAEEAQRIHMVRDLKEQRRRVKELLEHVRSQPTETDMMKEGIAILHRPGASDTEVMAALQALQVLVEPIDNANDLHPLGGIGAVVAQLTRGSELAAAAAHVLGTAASNNPTFQRHLLTSHPNIVGTLLRVSQSPHSEEAVKGMYALASVVRNLPEARRAFAEAAGFAALEVLLRGVDVAPRVKRKALSLFMDLMDTQPAEGAGTGSETGSGAGLAAGPPGGEDAGRQEAAADAQGGPHIRTLHDVYGAGSSGAAAEGTPAALDAQPGPAGGAEGGLAAAAISTGLPQAVVALLHEPDADMQEKALLVVLRLAASAAARRVLRGSGVEAAISSLYGQLQADAPKPGDEPDPYHDYLIGLVQQVTELMAREDVAAEVAAEADGSLQAGSGGGRTKSGGGAARRARESGGAAAAAVEDPPVVLALGGSRSSGRGGAGSAGGEAAEQQCSQAGDTWAAGQCAL